MIRICTSLSEAGYTVTLVGREIATSIPLQEEPFKQIRLKCIFNKGKLFYLEYNIKLLFFLLTSKFDMICGIDLDTALPAFLISRIKKKIFVHDAHEYFTEMEEVTNRPIVKSIWKSIERFFVPKTKYIYTVNESLAKIFKDEYKVQIQVIKNAPVLKPIETIEKEEKYIIYQGAMNIGRGLEEMMEAMTHFDTKFYICGDGYLYSKLIRLREKYGVKEKVEFLGNLEPEKLENYTQKATFGINVLENQGLNHYYSLANKFFDYIHAGIPQITSDFPEYRRVNEEFEVALLIDFNLKNIIDAMEQLLNDNSLNDKLSQNCLAAREIYNWQNEEQKLLEFYSSIE